MGRGWGWVIGVLFLIALTYLVFDQIADEKACDRGDDAACLTLERSADQRDNHR